MANLREIYPVFRSSMKIGIVSPFMPHELRDLLDEESIPKLGNFKGVTATPVTALAREWHRQGHSISIFCLDPSADRVHTLTGCRLVIQVIPKRRSRQCLPDCYRIERRQIRALVESDPPEVLSAQWSYEHALAALDTGLPTVVSCHDTPLRYAWISKSLFMTYHLVMAACVFRKASHLVAVSPYTADHIQRHFHPRRPPQVIPNGLPAEMFERGARRLEHERGNPAVYTICSVGGWGRIKNLKSLLMAFGDIRKEIQPSRLVLIGKDLGPGESAEKWAKARHLHHDVEFRGTATRDQILDFLEHEADLMVHPSLIECNPMVLMESLACGIPVIAGRNSGGVSWTLGDGHYGKLCDVRNPAEIATSVLEFRKELSANPEFVRDSWVTAKQRYGIESVAGKFVELFSHVIAAANR